MQKIQKAIIITSVLLAPIFVFLFLKKFGVNEFELPILYPDGNPIATCSGGHQQHRISHVAISNYSIRVPVLIYVASPVQNEYYSDLNNVLAKYPAINVQAVFMVDSEVTQREKSSINLSPEKYSDFINCDLVLGEDHFIASAIVNKYVLIDIEGRIRGYYLVDDLDEIERLDVELDILLNY